MCDQQRVGMELLDETLWISMSTFAYIVSHARFSHSNAQPHLIIRNPPLLPLNLIPKVKIPPIELMHPHIPILAPTRIPPPQRIHRNRVQGSEMTFDAADLVFEDFVVEAGFEFALAGGGGGDVHGCLAAAEDDEGFFGGDGCGVEGGVGGVGFYYVEVAGGD